MVVSADVPDVPEALALLLPVMMICPPALKKYLIALADAKFATSVPVNEFSQGLDDVAVCRVLLVVTAVVLEQPLAICAARLFKLVMMADRAAMELPILTELVALLVMV